MCKWPEPTEQSDSSTKGNSECVGVETLRLHTSLRGVSVSSSLVALWGRSEFEIFSLPSAPADCSPLPSLRRLVATAPTRGDLVFLVCGPSPDSLKQNPSPTLRVLQALEGHKGRWNMEELRDLDRQAKDALGAELSQSHLADIKPRHSNTDSCQDLGCCLGGDWRLTLTFTRLQAALNVAENACSSLNGCKSTRAASVGHGRLPGLRKLQPYVGEDNIQLVMAATQSELFLLSAQVRSRGPANV